MRVLKTIPLGEAAHLVNGDRGFNYPDREAQLSSGYCLFLNTKNVRKGKFDYTETAFIDEDRHNVLGGGTLERNDIVLTIRGTLGNTAVYDDSAPFKVVRINSAMLIVRPKPGFDPSYIERFLRSSQFLEWVGLNRRGSAQPHLRTKDIETAQLPLIALGEQRRIVAKLDALTDRLARARAELRRVKKMACVLREKGLEAAFEGTLVYENGEPKAGWRSVRFEEVGQISSHLVAPREILDFPHIAPNHIRSGIPHLLSYQTIREDEVISAKHRFFPGQIIYSKIRPNLRKAVIVNFEGACSADMYPINPRCNARYLLYWMLSPQFTWLATRQDGRTVLPKINQDALNAIITPLAPTATQERIAKALDAIFARADRLEAEAARASALLDRLEATIFAKAFRGELMPQDPSDEPASVLLERIRAKRAPTLKRKRLPKT